MGRGKLPTAPSSQGCDAKMATELGCNTCGVTRHLRMEGERTKVLGINFPQCKALENSIVSLTRDEM
jgi:hypothetical protein